MLTFCRIPKSKMMSHNCLWTCIPSLHSKRYDCMLNGTFSGWKETIKIIDLFHNFHKRENNSFSRIPKSKMMNHSCLWTCIAIAIIAFKTVRLDVKNGTFQSSWKQTVKIIDSFSSSPKQSQWPHSWVILSNYSRALLYDDLKRNR